MTTLLALIKPYLNEVIGGAIVFFAFIGLRWKWKIDGQNEALIKLKKQEIELQKKIMQTQHKIIKDHNEIEKQFKDMYNSTPNELLRSND